MSREYSVVIVNDTDATIREADVAFDGFHSGGGTLPPGIFSVYGGVTHRIPERALVRWRTSDGVLHEQEVEVRSLLPRDDKGEEVNFLIRQNNTVSVTFGRG
jgi:hypothetical protein